MIWKFTDTRAIELLADGDGFPLYDFEDAPDGFGWGVRVVCWVFGEELEDERFTTVDVGNDVAECAAAVD